MKQLIQSQQALPARLGLGILITLLLACFALSPQAQAVSPAPDGGYPGGNTAGGQAALLSLTTGTYNTAVGFYSLLSLTDGQFNTGVGAGALLANTGTSNTATGAGALLSNAAGFGNTANGAFALFNNTNGPSNTATGLNALFANTTGANNVAVGNSSLEDNTTGTFNTALGFTALANNTTANANTATGASALGSNTTGGDNTAMGFSALANNTTGDGNTAIGDFALYNNTTGFNNVALGGTAGYNATTGHLNVYIGEGMLGVADESNHTYIRNINTTSVSGGESDFVTVDLSTGLLGHASSSRRYKEDIKPMNDSSEALFALKPVTFRYKKEIDKSQSLEYGLIAEDVAQVDPNLAIRDSNGQIEAVRYTAINAMLLNEFLKEHKKVEEQEATIAQLRKEMETIVAQLEQQDAKIQKVSAQIKLNNSVPQLADTSH